jgi:dTDP-4-dehydrorhamnose reductase
VKRAHENGKREVNMKRIMITGAGGQLGLALHRLLKGQADYELFRTDAVANEDGSIHALDITRQEEVIDYIDSIKPNIIINCAAFTAVDLCESEEEKAYKINALGPKFLAMAAEKTGAALVHISTDYVFDGQGSVPYTEDAPTNPISVYGKTKQAGDEFVSEYCSKSFILRTAWVYGEGKNFVKTMLRLAQTNPKVRIVSDQYGTPTSALELARAIVFLMETESYGTYHATCEGHTNWYEFANVIFKEAGVTVEVEAISTAEYPTPAKRPMYSILDNKALRERHGYYMKDWKEAFKEYMREI